MVSHRNLYCRVEEEFKKKKEKKRKMSEKDTLSLKESIVNRVGSALTRLVIRLKAFDVKKTEKISPGETPSHWLTLKTPGVRGKLFSSFLFFFSFS